MVNIISLGISAPSCKKWEKKQGEKSYTQYQKLRLSQTGKLETQTIRIIQSQKIPETVVVITAIQKFRAPMQAVLDHMAEILEFSRSLPLLENAANTRQSFVINGGLPAYGIPEKTGAEKYAERLREDRWDVRRLGDPSEWRFVRV